MNKSIIVKLTDVCKDIFAGGDVPKDNYSSKPNDIYCIPIYTNGEQNAGLYGFTTKARVFEPSLTVSARGTIGFTAIRTTPFFPAIRLITLTPNEKIDIKYLFYVTQNYKFENGGTSIPQLTVPMLKSYTFPLPSLKIQKQIAANLDKVTNLIDTCNAILEKLDLLVKSRFVEMFGDPQKNTQNRPTTELINVVKMQRGFDLPTYNRNQNGDIPVYGANGALDRHDTAKVLGGGVITGRSGTIGNVYYTLGDYWPLNTSLFSSDLHGNNVIYLAYLLDLFDLTRFKEGTGVPTLNRNKFHKEQIIVVPITQQTEFAAFVAQSDKSKVAVQNVLEKAETLKKALMQEYFG